MKANKHLKIDIACPAWRGAPYPAFDKLKVNESKFEDGLRAKSWSIWIENGEGHIKWLSQNEDNPTDAWEFEVRRAFKENGLSQDQPIFVEFGSRSSGYIYEYVLKV